MLGAGEGPHWRSIEASARRLGHYCWLELQLFELLGGWVSTVAEPEVKLRVGPHSFHHAWHAELWRGLLPELAHLDREGLVRPPNEELVQFVEALAVPEGPGSTADRLVGVYRVLIPHKIAAYSLHLEQASSITDGPIIRALRLVLRDELEDRREGELLIPSLLSTDEDVQRADAHQARLESLLVAGGGLTGAVESDESSGPGEMKHKS